MSTFDFASLLFFMAAAIGFLNERTLRLPRVIALLLGSLAVSALIIAVDPLVRSHDLHEVSRQRLAGSNIPRILMDGVLALLLFAGSLHVDLRELRRQAWAVLGLATVGVVIGSIVFGAGIWAVFLAIGRPVAPLWCLVLGTILAPTDAVAVEGLLRRVPIPAGLKALISGESLFNDGAAVVLFVAAVSAAEGQLGAIGHGRIAFDLLVEGVGGAALGAATGYVAGQTLRRIEDRNLIVTVSLALVLTTYRLAVAFGLSGPIAVVVAGLVLANTEANAWKAGLVNFWSLVDDLLNTLLYMLMGFELLAVDLGPFATLAALAAIPLALLTRLVSVGAPMLVFD
ncbi:MAG: cation:proton antiporter, partial [Acetobacteraceae bacterium]